jgi:hypothetical protein
MTTNAQKKANAAYRARLAKRGLVRLEVIVPEKNKDMIKALAEQLTVAAMESLPIKSETNLENPMPSGKEIWQALREAPTDLTEFDMDRSQFQLRTVEL